MEKINKKVLSDLFKRIKAGDKEAAQELYNRYKTLVYGIAFSIAKNKDDSEDIVQNAFTKIIETEVDKLPTSHEATWLYTVTKNEALQVLRKKNNDLNLEEVYDIQNSDDELEKIIDKENYNKLISKLNKQDKEIISLKIISGLSFNEIGNLIGEPTSTIKWRYYKTVYRLKRLLESLSMAIITFVIGIATFKKTEKFDKDQVIEKETPQNEINNIENIDWGVSYDSIEQESTSRNSELQDKTTNNELANYAMPEKTNESTTNEATVKVQEHTQYTNYISLGCLVISIIFFVLTITIFLKKYQPKTKKKTSK